MEKISPFPIRKIRVHPCLKFIVQIPAVVFVATVAILRT